MPLLVPLLDPLAITTQGRWELSGLLLDPLAGTTQGRWDLFAAPPGIQPPIEFDVLVEPLPLEFTIWF